MWNPPCRWIQVAVAIVCLLVFVQPLRADVAWDESTDGDLSGDYQDPIELTFTEGTNSLFYNVVAGDLDYLTFNVPQGHELSAINLISYANSLGDEAAFIGVVTGTSFSFPASEAFTNVDKLLGWTLLGPDDDNLLPDIGAGDGAIGFTGNLPSGDYTFWLQQTGSATDVQLDFVVIPEPASAMLLGLGGLCTVVRRRR